jgi:chitinase
MSVLPARRVCAGLIVLAALAFTATSATAALDSKPTKPGNLRVTAKTTTSVSMAWNASTDNSGRGG